VNHDRPKAPPRTGASAPQGLQHDVGLADRTTLSLGGPARFLLEVPDAVAAAEALAWARSRGVPAVVLGGGSNVVVADQGFPGLVVVPTMTGMTIERAAPGVSLAVAAGEPWDAVVARAVGEGLAGVECLAGIPGSTGATPVQNVGAYGQEVADTITSVRVLDRSNLAERELPAEACGFGYRTSGLRRAPNRWLVLEVRFRLRPRGSPTILYPELERRVRERFAEPTLDNVCETVLELRRDKSMVLDDPEDPNRRSAGSFFVNPVLDPEGADEVAARALALGVVAGAEQVPRFTTGEGRVKIPAAWLVEAAGFRKGFRRGAVGLSSRHALALVHHGGGNTAELVALARDIRNAVRTRFGVTLQPEPVFLGFPDRNPLG
jgi:UDP-N-acetylmuramate dehydrogenase